jgi:hypothetical protein
MYKKMFLVFNLLLTSLPSNLYITTKLQKQIEVDSSSSYPSLKYVQEERWNISEPEFEYTDHQFILEWQVSNFIQDRLLEVSPWAP